MASETPTITITKSGVSLFQSIAGRTDRRPCLILYSGPDAGLPFDLEPGRFVIGRTPDVQLHIDNPGVSRRHAELNVGEDQVVLSDLGSSNGTFINETRLTAPTALKNGDLVRLGVMVLRFYERQSLEAALHDRIYRTATVDNTTEIFNRRYVFDTLKREMRLARQRQRPLAVVCYDLDHFKAVNDRYGHASGDAVLKASAGLLRASQQGAGVLGRLGGEEFALVLPGADVQQAFVVAERGRVAVAEHPFTVTVPGQAAGSSATHRQTLSAGIALLDDTMNEVADLLAAADRQLYASKHAGRNRVSG